jgi:tRNA A-37 threonylcarbamoyl transferase component Bud32
MAGDGRVQRQSVDGALEARVGQVLNDFLDRRERGEQVSEAELLAQHPDLTVDLREHLDLLRDIEPTRHALVELLNRGILAQSADTRYQGRLGPYQVVGLLGRGGMGVVLKAYEERLNRTVALKLLRPELTSDKTALARFEREAKAAAGLQHPNIVAVHAIGEENGTHFIVMEFVSGPTLAALVRKEGPLPAERVRVLFGQILAGLKAAHDAGLVHRDIKSSNILLHGPEQNVKIADFGLARMLSAETRMTMNGSVFGTPTYMSPEQARGDENIDHRTDLYSAGVVLYEMLTGRVPFRADASSALIHAILNTEPPDPRALRTSADKHLSRLALRLMAKERGDRFSAAVDALTALEQGRGVRLRWSNRFRRRMLGAVCLVASVTCLLWAASSYLLPLKLTKVGVGIDNDKATPRIEARWGSNLEFEEFYTFPPAAGFVASVEKVDPGPGYETIVLASTHAPVDGKSLFAFRAGRVSDERHKPFWSESLFRPFQWPDTTVTEFCTGPILASNYDGNAGEEVVLIASDQNQYPSYIALFDPRELTIRARYWHIGNLNEIVIAPDFLGPGRPAIIALGINNKLDGFLEQRADDPRPLASFDWVSVLMILDINEMKGERLINIPNARGRMPDLPPVLPYAYAFLNAAPNKTVLYVDPMTRESRDPNVDPEDGEVLCFAVPSIASCSGSGPSGSCIQVSLHRGPAPTSGGAVLWLDSDFVVRGFDPLASERAFRTKEPWLERFKPLVVQSKYVGSSQ